MASMVRIGIDIGGAFTDLVAYDNLTKDLKWVKVESTPQDLSTGVLDCVRRSGVNPKDMEQIIHGQTVVINTIIERKGVKVGLLTTKGHRDVLEIQRANRRDMYNFRYRKPEALVPRYLRMEIDERTMADGTILKELNTEQVERAAKRLVDEDVDGGEPSAPRSLLSTRSVDGLQRQLGRGVHDECPQAEELSRTVQHPAIGVPVIVGQSSPIHEGQALFLQLVIGEIDEAGWGPRGPQRQHEGRCSQREMTSHG